MTVVSDGRSAARVVAEVSVLRSTENIQYIAFVQSTGVLSSIASWWLDPTADTDK